MARSKQSRRAIIVLVVLLLAAILAVVAAIGSQGFTNKNVKSWFNGWGNADYVGDPGSGLSLAAYSLTAEDYAEFGISEQAIEAKVITAEFEPANATNKRVNWTWNWAGDKPEWSEGKDINEYVDFTAAANYAPELTFAVKKAFGDGIVVECVSRAKPELSDSVQIEYMARYDDPWGDSDIGLYNLDYLPIFDELCNSAGEPYSITPDSFSATVKITVWQNYLDWLNSKGYEQCNDSVVTYENVTENIPFSKIFYDTDLNPEWIAEICSEKGASDAWFTVTATITCYYEGEELYTFTDTEGVWIDSELLEQMSVPPTNVKLPGDTIIV